MSVCWRIAGAAVRSGYNRKDRHRLSSAATSCNCSLGRMNGSSVGSTGSRSGDSERKPQRLGVSQSCLAASTLSSTFNGTKVQVFSNDAGFRWRKRVGVEATGERSFNNMRRSRWPFIACFACSAGRTEHKLHTLLYTFPTLQAARACPYQGPIPAQPVRARACAGFGSGSTLA